MHEIMSRKGVWGSMEMTPEEIVTKVREEPMKEKDVFRPLLEDIQCQDFIVKVITDSWAENPENRPDITNNATRLKKIRRGMNDNIVDNMVTMLEKYANNLEEIVCDRTRKLEEEKKKTETLLHRMLPKSVAVQLMGGEYVEPESFDGVTIYFSDIVGFTDMSSTSTPMEVVGFLNDLYTLFDSIIRNYNVYKVETIGDAYMVVSGLPERNGNEHASEIALMALELLDAIKTFKIRHRPEQQLKLRIGLHTGTYWNESRYPSETIAIRPSNCKAPRSREEHSGRATRILECLTCYPFINELHVRRSRRRWRGGTHHASLLFIWRYGQYGFSDGVYRRSPQSSCQFSD